jgi:hypothetical protein
MGPGAVVTLPAYCRVDRMISGEELIAIALEAKAANAALLETSKIEFHEGFRKACAGYTGFARR